jgi:ribosomal protein L11 methyltransferase
VIRLAVRVGRADAELVLAELLALSPGGLEERDLDPDTVEYALYGAEGELPDLGSLRAAAGDALVDVVSERVPDDWAERWKAWHRPVDVSWRFRRLRVRPPWEPPADGAMDIVIDPGQAFGTGAHHTTRLCLELLLETDPGGAFADWGCGTGVLEIAAARLGFAPVVAVDNDPLAVEATRENAAANGLAATELGAPASRGGAAPAVAVGRCDLRREPGPWAPTVTANLLRPLLLDVAALLERVPDRLIASGLLREEADAVADAFARHGLREAARRVGGVWAAILLAR